MKSKMMNMNKMKNKIFVKALISITMSIGLIAAPVSASALSATNGYFASESGQAACGALNTLNSSQSCGANSQSSIDTLIQTVVNIMSIIVGIVAVIMIIVSGMRFVTSGGDSQKVSGAKSALIYALIGLVIIGLAQAIVYFTISNATSAVSS
jgi:hypothetical protein